MLGDNFFDLNDPNVLLEKALNFVDYVRTRLMRLDEVFLGAHIDLPLVTSRVLSYLTDSMSSQAELIEGIHNLLQTLLLKHNALEKYKREDKLIKRLQQEYKKLENYDLHKLHQIHHPYAGKDRSLEAMKSTILMAISKTKYSIEVMNKLYEDATTEKVREGVELELDSAEDVRSDDECS